MFDHQELLVGGFFMGGPCDSSIGKQVLVSPFSGSVAGTAAESSWSEAEAALHHAHGAFTAWRATPGEERARLLLRAVELLQEREDEFAMRMAREIGKPLRFGYGELHRGGITLRLSADLAAGMGAIPISLKEDPRSPHYDVTAHKEPIGPVLCITPYNWPINLALHKLGPALAAGNTVVLKGSPFASLSTLALGRLFHEAGFPPGVVNTVNCMDSDAARLVADPRTAMVSFTGSPRVGWAIRDTHPRKKLLLELGGNAFALVLPGADLDHAAMVLAQSAFGYAGQVCISAQNILVHSSLYDAFRERFLAAAKAIPCGDPEDEMTVCGPLIHAEAADRVEALVAGLDVHRAGPRDRNVVPPIVVEHPDRDHPVYAEEAFGPVATLSVIESAAEGQGEVNRSRYAIHTSVFGEASPEFVGGLSTAGVVLNDAPTVRFDMAPYGGLRDSGLGREGPAFAFDSVTEWKTVMRRKG